MILPFFSCQYWHGRLLTIIIYFYKVYLNTLDVFFCWILICVRSGHSLEESALEGTFEDQCILRHQMGFKSGGFLSTQSTCKYPLLSPGCPLPLLLDGGFLWDVACPKRFLVFLGLRNSQRYCSVPAINILVIILPDFFYCCSETEKVSWALFPDI